MDVERKNPKTLWSFLRNPEAKPGFDIPDGFVTEQLARDAMALAETGRP